MSHNQQGVTGAINTNFGMSYNNYYWVTDTQSGWIPHNDQSASSYQVIILNYTISLNPFMDYSTIKF